MEENAKRVWAISQAAYTFHSPWTVEEFESDMAQPFSHYLYSGEPTAAFLAFHQVCDEIEITNIASEEKRKGHGSILMQRLIAHAKQQNIQKIFLEVRESNEAARALYASFGFEKIGIRKNYYQHPKEHAVLLCLKVGDTNE